MKRLFLLLFPILMLASCGGPKTWGEAEAPIAEQKEEMLIAHGDTRIDFYYWLRERESPEVIAYLEAENTYLEAKMNFTAELQDTLFEEMKGRIKEDDQSAPFLSNGFYYYTRYEKGHEYPIYCRREGSMDTAEEILLNVNELAEGYPYFNVGDYDISLNNKLMAFSIDTMGRRQYTILFKDLETGTITESKLPNLSGNVVWAADHATVFYTSIDPVTLRYDRVYRYHFMNGEVPVEVYYEADETFYNMGVSRSKDDRFIMINISSTLSNEVRYLSADQPESTFQIFQERQPDMLYEVAPWKDKFYVTTNLEAQNFRLMETPINSTDMSHWEEVIAHRSDVLLEGIEVFTDYLVLQERSKGLRQLRVIHQADGQEHYLPFEEEAYTAGISANAVMNTPLLRYSYTSLTTPMSQYDYNMETGEATLVKQQEVLGDFDPVNYETRRFYVTARDGAEVPVTMVYTKGIEKNGNNPLLLYGYGSYGITTDPRFSSNVLSLLDRGFIYAMAHIRGGQEMGRQWYEDGKLLKKINTFYDFIDIADFLVAEGYTNPEKLFASGGSAGGLLVGAVINQRPELFKGVIAAVPFVDVVTTMLDETIPLTTAEYDEWGNPNVKEYYDYMLSYSPYDNVIPAEYPNILVTAGLHDSQVQYWEPAKWVAKLRQNNTGDNMILLYTNMEAGHGGASGRFRRLREVARQYAFLLELAK
ncbi:MAG: S9 family peptidase [Bacteroides sp.]|jgi:oligopeptidase B|nr:S9 family peptidase [Bacteroides sp.]